MLSGIWKSVAALSVLSAMGCAVFGSPSLATEPPEGFGDPLCEREQVKLFIYPTTDSLVVRNEGECAFGPVTVLLNGQWTRNYGVIYTAENSLVKEECKRAGNPNCDTDWSSKNYPLDTFFDEGGKRLNIDEFEIVGCTIEIEHPRATFYCQ